MGPTLFWGSAGGAYVFGGLHHQAAAGLAFHWTRPSTPHTPSLLPLLEKQLASGSCTSAQGTVSHLLSISPVPDQSHGAGGSFCLAPTTPPTTMLTVPCRSPTKALKMSCSFAAENCSVKTSYKYCTKNCASQCQHLFN